MTAYRKFCLILSFASFLDSAEGRVPNPKQVSVVVDQNHYNATTTQRRSLTGERCGIFFGSCADGLTCVNAAFGTGRCLPVECMAEALKSFNEQQSIAGLEATLEQQIFGRAGITPEQLAVSRASEARSDKTFREESDAMQAIVEAMNTMENPFPGLQAELDACNAQGDYGGTTRAATTPGTTMYYGFHIEGGVLYDGEFSVLTASADNQPNLTFIRGCFGGGGAGFDISYLIGMGYTGTREDLLGCSALLTDFELGALFAFGVSLGLTFDGVFYLDITLGAGITGEGLGIGLCGNWQT